MPDAVDPPVVPADPSSGRFLVCGMGQSGYRIVRLLLRLGERVTVVALEVRDEWKRIVESLGAIVLIGDARDTAVLVGAGLDSALALIAATDNDLVNLEIALDVKNRRQELPSVIRIFDQALAHQLEASFDVRRALSMSQIAAPMFAAAAMGESGVCAFRVLDQFFVVQSMTVPEGSPMAHRSLQEMRESLKLAALDYHRRDDANENEEFKSETKRESANQEVLPGDQVLTMSLLTDWQTSARDESGGSSSNPQSRANRAFEPLVNGIRPAFWVDLARQLWLGASLPLRSIFLVLNIVILLSVGVFHVGMKLSLVDALYFVVATVTTVGYGDITPRSESTAIKLYACLLMILGSATIATLFSIITDFIVTARFQQLLGRQRVPQSGHYIVVGLGTVGYRLVDKLHRTGAQVVAVDRGDGGEFVESVRSIVPVVIGDARLRNTLLKAGAARARAVLAVTSNDAVNLGVALEVKQINKDVRTVARLFEPDFAEKVKAQLHVDAAMGAFYISAPTFVASALYPDVMHAFVVGDSLYSVLNRQVREEWHNKTPTAVRKSSGIDVVMRKESGGSKYHVAQPDEPLHRNDWTLAVVTRPLVSK